MDPPLHDANANASNISYSYSYNTPPFSDDSLIGKTEIVAFCNYNFRSVALTWYRRMSQLGYTTHVVVATDPPMVEFLRTKTDFRYQVLVHEPLPKDVESQPRKKKDHSILKLLMAVRWKFLLQKLESGIHVLLTDVDNVFNRYIDMEDELVRKDPSIDLYHAYATKFPPKIFQQQGFVVCSGMSWWRASPAAIRFSRIIHQACGIMCDDQRVLNALLVAEEKLGMTWHWTPQALQSRITDADDNRILGLPTIGITGTSNVTLHKAGIWDRDFAYRGPIEETQCPKNNWVSMPNIEAKSRSTAWMAKIESFSDWDRICGSELHPLAK
jgi:hypothetical protein